MKTLLRLLLKSQHQRNRSGPAQTEKGMTLVELLVGSIMAFLIITPMLTFVVDMLNTDRREQVKSNTEQDIQAAADFISQDLSQAIYIYDQAGITAINNTNTKLPTPPLNTTGTPILVFWKRQLMKKAIPVDPSTVPKDCDQNECNDTYVLSLVAYYQFKETDLKSIWCQPSGGTCPTRIARYEIRDGIKNPLTQAYYADSDITTGQGKDPAFNKDFDLTKPTVNVTDPTGLTKAQFQVLVNYIDHSPGPTPIDPNECTTALGNPIDQRTATRIGEATLKITDNSTNSFYACVDTSKNIARVTIRGNSLRRLQPDANFKTTSSAFFPITTVQVKGLSGLGK